MSDFAYSSNSGSNEENEDGQGGHSKIERKLEHEDVDGHHPEPINKVWMGEAALIYLMDITFADLIVQGNVEADAGWHFRLNRSFACTKSGYIRNNCKLSSRKDHLININVGKSVMKTVIRFMYTDIYQIMGYEVDELNSYDFFPRIKNGYALIASKVLSDVEGAILLEIPDMIDAILKAVGEDLLEAPKKRSLLGSYGIRLLCKIFSLKGTHGEWNREKMAQIIIKSFSVKEIEKELAKLAGDNPEGSNVIIYTGGFQAILSDGLKKWKADLKENPDLKEPKQFDFDSLTAYWWRSQG
ncbi:hypothetical protein TWF730_003651 [Orbilia blumenaviensis]|uniref:Uncharacterized protein n=1 Tax=Orbilia blumenaviensis TaxID=1796055 RepID=A0AAV9U348_9PEZI